MTLNDLERRHLLIALILRYFTEFDCSAGGLRHTVTVVEDRPIMSAKCRLPVPVFHFRWSGVLVSTLALISEVNLRRTRLVLRWVTVSGSILGAGHLFQYVTNQPPKANLAFHPSGVGK